MGLGDLPLLPFKEALLMGLKLHAVHRVVAVLLEQLEEPPLQSSNSALLRRSTEASRMSFRKSCSGLMLGDPVPTSPRSPVKR